jgi:ATP-binding cassette, subfamily B, bacterial
MGFFAGLGAEKYDRQYTDRELVRRILFYFKPHIGRLVIIGILIIAMSRLGAQYPVAASRGVDWISSQGDPNAIYLIAGIVLAIGVGRWLLNCFNRILMVRTIADLLLTMSSAAFQAALNHDLSFYDQFSSGKIQSRITSDTREFGQLVSLITDLVSQVAEAMFLGIFLIQIEWHLSLFVFALIPVVFAMAILYRKAARVATKRGMQATAEVNSTIKETVSGIAVAKNYRQEASIYDTFQNANNLSYRVNLRRGLTLAIVFPTLNALGGIATGVMVYAGGLSASQGIVTAGAWYLFILSLDRFLFPVMNLASFWTQVQSGLSAAERVFALIDASPAVIQKDNQPVPELRGEIEFEHLNFRYKDAEPVLDDYSLCVQPGETVALVGHTGAGKSSIAKLIARFYEFQEGQLRIDGRDVRTFDLEDYRRRLGIVSQAPFLFSGSVLENIRYARQDASEDEVRRIARQIGDGDWVDALPNGLETQVGERGGRLSMGQRQLVALMRVLVQKPAIFILDEATASIDPFTEWQIRQALNLILKHSTSILIAHRLSTVRSADRIIVLENGHIIEEGDHEGLLARGGHYAGLYNTYFRHQSLDYRPAGLDEFLAGRLNLEEDGSNH